MAVALAVVETEQAAQQFRSVELAQRQERRDAWELADAIYDDVVSLHEEVATSSSDHTKTGLGKAEEIVAEAHRQAGTEITKNSLHGLFVTRRAWPPDLRAPEVASFAAHYELRGNKFKNRRAVLERLAGKTKTGRVTRHQVQVWKSERRPPAVRTFLELAEQRIRVGVKAAGHPWAQLAEGDRLAIARVLRTIADEVQEGTFTGKKPR